MSCIAENKPTIVAAITVNHKYSLGSVQPSNDNDNTTATWDSNIQLFRWPKY